jgi:hypothetical protein
MYKQVLNQFTHLVASVQRLEDGAFIPFDPANTDYQQFKIQVADGTPLEDPDGNVMTQEEVDAFLRTIP